jgi:hypothetical protein
MGFVVGKVEVGQVYFGPSVNPHSINCSTIAIIYHLGLVQ